jgi:hypothetical protein
MESNNVTYQSVDNPELFLSSPDANLFAKGWAELDLVWKIVVCIGLGVCGIFIFAVIYLCCGLSKRRRTKKTTRPADLELGTVPNTAQRATEVSSSADKSAPGKSRKQQMPRMDSASKISKPAKSETRSNGARTQVRTDRFERI